MITKSQLQDKAVKLSRHNSNLLLEWATGVGKSKAAIDIQKDFNPKSTYLVVAEVAHINNWKKEYKEYKALNLFLNTDTFCYASLGKYVNTEVDLLILDEGHSTSELRLDYLSTIKAKKVIILSATMDGDRFYALQAIFGKFAVSRVPLQMAIDYGILPIPKIYTIPLLLNNKDKTEVITEEWGTKKLRQVIQCDESEKWKYTRKKFPHLRLEMKATQARKYEQLTDKGESYKKQYMRTRQEFIKNMWLQAGSERKRFLGECKTPYVAELLRKIKNKRYICFCTTIAQANTLGGNSAIHSKIANPLEKIEQFNNKEVDNLVVVGMLQQGQNLRDIEVGVIVQLDGKERAFIQKFGRTLRAESPLQFIFYYPNTRDEEYLEKALEGINPEYVQEVKTVSEIII